MAGHLAPRPVAVAIILLRRHQALPPQTLPLGAKSPVVTFGLAGALAAMPAVHDVASASNANQTSQPRPKGKANSKQQPRNNHE
mgnify:CR=1 FL=1